jgi:hypothetical protein
VGPPSMAPVNEWTEKSIKQRVIRTAGNKS